MTYASILLVFVFGLLVFANVWAVFLTDTLAGQYPGKTPLEIMSELQGPLWPLVATLFALPVLLGVGLVLRIGWARRITILWAYVLSTVLVADSLLSIVRGAGGQDALNLLLLIGLLVLGLLYLARMLRKPATVAEFARD